MHYIFQMGKESNLHLFVLLVFMNYGILYASEHLRGGLMNKTRYRIMEAAMNLIIEQGYPATTTKDIAKAAQVNESTLFRKFRSKKDIVLAAMQDEWHPQLSKADFAPVTEQLVTDLMRFSSVYMQKVTPRFVQLSIGLRCPQLSADTTDGIMRVPAVYKEVLEEYFQRMMKLGKMKQADAEALAMTFLSMTFGFVFLKASFTDRLTSLKESEYIQCSVKAFVEGVTV